MTGHTKWTAREILEGEGRFGGVWDEQRRVRRLGNVDCVRNAGRGRGEFPEGGRSEKSGEGGGSRGKGTGTVGTPWISGLGRQMGRGG